MNSNIISKINRLIALLITTVLISSCGSTHKIQSADNFDLTPEQIEKLEKDRISLEQNEEKIVTYMMTQFPGANSFSLGLDPIFNKDDTDWVGCASCIVCVDLLTQSWCSIQKLCCKDSNCYDPCNELPLLIR